MSVIMIEQPKPASHDAPWILLALGMPPNVRASEAGAATLWLLLGAVCVFADGAMIHSPVFGALAWLLPQHAWAVVFLLWGTVDTYALLAVTRDRLPFAAYCRTKRCRLHAMHLNVYLGSLVLLVGLMNSVILPMVLHRLWTLPVGLVPIVALTVTFYVSLRDLARRDG